MSLSIANLKETSRVNFDFYHHDLDSLKALYKRENEELKSKLLNGALWEEVKDQRLRVTELSIALANKLQSDLTNNPAEFPFRNIEGR